MYSIFCMVMVHVNECYICSITIPSFFLYPFTVSSLSVSPVWLSEATWAAGRDEEIEKLF